MAKKKKRNQSIQSLNELDLRPPHIELSAEAKRGIVLVILLSLGLITALSLFHGAGPLGDQLARFMAIVFGVSRITVPIILIVSAYYLLRPPVAGIKFSKTIGIGLLLLSGNAFLHTALYSNQLGDAARDGLGGGLIGLLIAYPAVTYLGFWAAIVVELALSAIGAILLFESYVASLMTPPEQADDEEDEDEEDEDEEERDGDEVVPMRGHSLFSRMGAYFGVRSTAKTKEPNPSTDAPLPPYEPAFATRDVEQNNRAAAEDVEEGDEEEGDEEEMSPEETKEDSQLNMSVAKFKAIKIDLPLSLLDGKTTTPKSGDIKANQAIIKKTFENFGISVEMAEAQVGPTVTQYTLKPSEGVKLSRITGLGDNLALALAAHPIRIEAPVPGKSLVGIEVPNQATAVVPLNEILNSDDFKNRKSNLSIALGKDVMGKPWMVALDKMPHMLIAGATGSGKSVAINTVILSLLFQNGPGDLKFIMVDPKRVELPGYNGIPHLLTPVITDVKKTINALRWSMKEMERRFDVLSAAGHRNIASYNDSLPDSKLPYIVIIIDELADLMATSGPEVESAIVRLSQMARAVGIHLILATQRPSVDVITGLIKANIPARIAFSVASLVDSRTILDLAGAEKLLGRGDMLFICADISKPKRLQGAFASDEEIRRVIEYLKERAEPSYIEEVVEKPASATGFADGSGDDDGDPLLQEAKEVIVRAGKASASLLQRRLRVGYARAARILDLLEEQGVIGPGDGAKPRDVLISSVDSDIMEDTPDDDGDFDDADADDDGETDRPAGPYSSGNFHG